MHLMRPTPTQKWRKCLEKESFVPRPCTDVSHQQHAARGLPSPVCTQKGRHCLSGAWSHPFPEFGHNHRHLICNICPCSVVMQHSPNSHGTFFFFFFAIKACDVLEKVQCFPKIHCPVTAALATSENLSPGFVECLVMIKVALIL